MWSALELAAGSADLWFTQFCSSWFVRVCVVEVRLLYVFNLFLQFPLYFLLCLTSHIYNPRPSLSFTALLEAKDRSRVADSLFVEPEITFNVSELFTGNDRGRRRHICPIIREGNKIWCWKCKYTVFINPYWHWRSCVWKHLQLEVKISRLSPSPVQWVSYKTVEMFPVCERLQQVAVMITQQLTSRSQRCGWNVTFKISNLSFTRSPAQLLMLLRPHLVADCREKQLHFDQVGWECWRRRRDKNTLLLYWLYVPTDLNWNHTAWHHLTECILIYVSCYRVCVEQETQWRSERPAVS